MPTTSSIARPTKADLVAVANGFGSFHRFASKLCVAIVTILLAVFLYNGFFQLALLFTERGLSGVENDSSGLFGFNFSSQMVGAFVTMVVFFIKPIYLYILGRYMAILYYLEQLGQSEMDAKSTIFFVIKRVAYDGAFAVVKAIMTALAIAILLPIITNTAISVSADILNRVSNNGESLSADALAQFTQGTAFMVAVVVLVFLVCLKVYYFIGLFGSKVKKVLAKIHNDADQRKKSQENNTQSHETQKEMNSQWKSKKFSPKKKSARAK